MKKSQKGSTADLAGRISELEDSTTKISESEEWKKNEKKWTETKILVGHKQQTNGCSMGAPEVKEEGTKKITRRNNGWKLPNLMKDVNRPI